MVSTATVASVPSTMSFAITHVRSCLGEVVWSERFSSVQVNDRGKTEGNVVKGSLIMRSPTPQLKERSRPDEVEPAVVEHVVDEWHQPVPVSSARPLLQPDQREHWTSCTCTRLDPNRT
jgi:hypothetical protein